MKRVHHRLDSEQNFVVINCLVTVKNYYFSSHSAKDNNYSRRNNVLNRDGLVKPNIVARILEWFAVIQIHDKIANNRRKWRI